MRWLRELAAWGLLLLGLLIFYVVFGLLMDPAPRYIASGPLTVIGIVVFRGGIHLLKVSAAAQACYDLQVRLKETKDTTMPARGTTRFALNEPRR
jgi:hypothetical protein